MTQLLQIVSCFQGPIEPALLSLLICVRGKMICGGEQQFIVNVLFVPPVSSFHPCQKCVLM